MKKKIFIGLTISGLLYLLFAGYAEYLWQTKGAGMIIDRQKVIGVSTNEYQIRDQDLALVNSLQVSYKSKKLLIKVAQDYQSIVLHSNDMNWIRSNGRDLEIRNYCALDEEYIRNKKSSKGKVKFMDTFLDSDERDIFYKEYNINYRSMKLATSFPTDEEISRVCE